MNDSRFGIHRDQPGNMSAFSQITCLAVNLQQIDCLVDRLFGSKTACRDMKMASLPFRHPTKRVLTVRTAGESGETGDGTDRKNMT